MIFAFPLTAQGRLGPGTRREEGSAEAAEGAEEPTEGAGEEGHSHPGRRPGAGDARGGHDGPGLHGPPVKPASLCPAVRCFPGRVKLLKCKIRLRCNLQDPGYIVLAHFLTGFQL